MGFAHVPFGFDTGRKYLGGEGGGAEKEKEGEEREKSHGIVSVTGKNDR